MQVSGLEAGRLIMNFQMKGSAGEPGNVHARVLAQSTLQRHRERKLTDHNTKPFYGDVLRAFRKHTLVCRILSVLGKIHGTSACCPLSAAHFILRFSIAKAIFGLCTQCAHNIYMVVCISICPGRGRMHPSACGRRWSVGFTTVELKLYRAGKQVADSGKIPGYREAI
jgi:hypothetical protein